MITKQSLVTAPALPPIGLTQVKTFLRVDGTDEDTQISTLINAATKRLEAETDCKFVTQTWDIVLDCFPYKSSNKSNDWWDGTRDGAISQLMSPVNFIELPFGPLQSITSFKTFDDSNNEFLFTDFHLDTLSTTPKIALKQSGVWPTTVLRSVNGIVIRGVFGFGTGDNNAGTNGAVPEDIREAIKQMVGIMYEHRGDEMPKIPSTASMLIEPYRRIKV